MPMKSPRYLMLMSMLTVTFWIICVVCQYRLMPLRGWGDISTADLPYPLLCLLFDMVAEVYGYRTSRRMLWMALISILIFGLSIMFILHLPMPNTLTKDAWLFNHTLQHVPRLMIFNTAALILGQYLNLFIFAKFQRLWKGRYFAIRSVLSTLCGDCLTFFIALFGDYWHLMHASAITLLILEELFLMYLIASALSLPGSLCVKFLKKREPPLNHAPTFNPFQR